MDAVKAEAAAQAEAEEARSHCASSPLGQVPKEEDGLCVGLSWPFFYAFLIVSGGLK